MLSLWTNVVPNQGERYFDPRRYKRLVGKLNYLGMTRPNIAFAISIVSQSLNSPNQDQWHAILRILNYIKNVLGKGLI